MGCKRMIVLICFNLASSLGNAIPTVGQRLAVSAPSHYAVETAQHVLGLGGNAVDVAVAMALTLSVTTPYYASLGGGGFAMIHMKGKTKALDFRETAPKALNMQSFDGLPASSSKIGGLAVGVPGVPAGLYELHRTLGALKWKMLFKDAIHLAQKGFHVSGEWADNTLRAKEKLNPTARSLFLKPSLESYLPQDKLTQPKLGRALQRLRDSGRDGFYKGPVAQDIVEAVTKANGKLSLEDLSHYQVEWREPDCLPLDKVEVCFMPPPSSASVVVQTALRLEGLMGVSASTRALSVDEFHLLGMIMARAFRARSMLGDPKFTVNPVAELLSADMLKTLQKSIDLRKATDLSPLPETFESKESTETTHLSVLDKDGNGVAMTLTLNGDYGSGLATSEFGIALNNQMDDFTTDIQRPNKFGLIQGRANRVEGGKRPLSSMSPLIVRKEGRGTMALGSPGGPRILSTVFQIVYRVLKRNLDIDQAIQAPRVHQQLTPNSLMYEANRFSPEILDALRTKGHTLEEIRNVGRGFGVRLNDKGLLEAAFDSRGEGAAAGF